MTRGGTLEMGGSVRRFRLGSWPAIALILIGLVATAIAWSSFRPRRSSLDLGLQAYKRGDWAEAADIARKQLREDAGNTEGLRLLARATARAGRDSSANALFAR